MSHECYNCHTEYPDGYNWIEIENPRIVIRNNGDGCTLCADGIYYFCGIACLNTCLMRVASDNFD